MARRGLGKSKNWRPRLLPSSFDVARAASSPPYAWRCLGRHSQLRNRFANVTNIAGIETNPLEPGGGRSANFGLPSLFDDIILGHEI